MKRFVMKRLVIFAAAAAAALRMTAGTVIADRVLADEALVREIGLRPPDAPETLYYTFTDDGGGDVSDDSGNGYDAAASGCVWTNAGRPGGSMAFDGFDDYVSVGDAPDFPSWDAYTVSLWFLHDGGGDFTIYQYGHKMLDKTSMYHDWHLSMWPFTGTIGLTIYEGVSVSMSGGPTNYMDGAWHHVAAVRDGTNGWFWVDGELKDASTAMVPVYSGSPLCVGCSLSSDSYQRKSWSGMLDEVRVFDRALSSNEVALLYVENAIPSTNAAPDAVLVSTNLTVRGGLSVTGRVSFAEGVYFSRPLGDLSCGAFTNAP